MFTLRDEAIFAILGIVLLVLLTIIVVLEVVFPLSLDVVVIDGEYYMECKSKQNVFDHVNAGIVLIAMCGSMYLGGLAMKLRHLNDQFNETKEIAVILYNNTIFLALILLFFLGVFEFDPITDYVIISTLWCFMLVIDISVLLVPKFWKIHKQVKFLSTSLGKKEQIIPSVSPQPSSTSNYLGSGHPGTGDKSPSISGTPRVSITEMKLYVDTQAPSVDDVRNMKTLLSRLGYVVVKKGERGKSITSFESSQNSSRNASRNTSRNPSKNTSQIKSQNISNNKSRNNFVSDDGNRDGRVVEVPHTPTADTPELSDNAPESAL